MKDLLDKNCSLVHSGLILIFDSAVTFIVFSVGMNDRAIYLLFIIELRLHLIPFWILLVTPTLLAVLPTSGLLWLVLLFGVLFLIWLIGLLILLLNELGFLLNVHHSLYLLVVLHLLVWKVLRVAIHSQRWSHFSNVAMKGVKDTLEL